MEEGRNDLRGALLDTMYHSKICSLQFRYVCFVPTATPYRWVYGEERREGTNPGKRIARRADDDVGWDPGAIAEESQEDPTTS